MMKQPSDVSLNGAKEIETIFLDEEEKVLNKLKSTYSKSLKNDKAYAKKL